MSAIFEPNCEGDRKEAFFARGRLHYLGAPFRPVREAFRRLRHGAPLPRGKAGPVP